MLRLTNQIVKSNFILQSRNVSCIRPSPLLTVNNAQRPSPWSQGDGGSLSRSYSFSCNPPCRFDRPPCPPQQPNYTNPLLAFIAGLALGFGLNYLFGRDTDPVDDVKKKR